MECLCGREMKLLGTLQPEPYVRVWACPPEGCGRIFLEGAGMEIKGTWYQAEQNASQGIKELELLG